MPLPFYLVVHNFFRVLHLQHAPLIGHCTHASANTSHLTIHKSSSEFCNLLLALINICYRTTAEAGTLANDDVLSHGSVNWSLLLTFLALVLV